MTRIDEKLVAVEQYESEEMAYLARIDLAGAGIEAFLANQNFLSTYWLYGVFTGGVKLLVRQNDLEQARQVLHEIKTNVAVLDEKERQVPEEGNDLACPACNSWDVDFETFSRKGFFLSILLFNFPISIKTNRAVCRQCGHTWKQR